MCCVCSQICRTGQARGTRPVGLHNRSEQASASTTQLWLLQNQQQDLPANTHAQLSTLSVMWVSFRASFTTLVHTIGIHTQRGKPNLPECHPPAPGQVPATALHSPQRVIRTLLVLLMNGPNASMIRQYCAAFSGLSVAVHV